MGAVAEVLSPSISHSVPRTRLLAIRQLGALAVFIVFAMLRIGLVDRHGLWADETFSLAMATGHSLEHPAAEADAALGDYVETKDATTATEYQKYLEHDAQPASLARVVRAVFKSDTSPPLYYLLLSIWTRAFGTSDAALRMFSAACALVCFPLLWLVGRAIGGRKTALIACILFTVSPNAVYYGTEGRMYSLLWVWTLASMALTLRLQRRGNDFATSLLWIVCAVAGLMTHYFFLFALGAMGLWLLIYPGRSSRVKTFITGAVAGLIVLPWFIRIPQALAAWRVCGEWLNNLPYQGFNRLTATLELPWTYFSIRHVWGGRAVFDICNAVLLVSLVIFAIWKLRTRLFQPRLMMLWLCAACACGGLILFDLWRHTYTTACPRYAFAGFPAAIVLVAFAISRLSAQPRFWFTLLIVLVWSIGLRRIYANDTRLNPSRQLGELINRTATPDDVVITSSIPSGVVAVARYVHDTPGKSPAFASWVGQLDQRHVPEDIQHLASGRKRIILIRMHEVGAKNTFEPWLWDHTRYVKKLRIEDVTVGFFEPLEGERFR